MDAKRLVLTRLLPKTGQVTEYQAGDDGQYEAGWWRGRLNVNNKNRFIAKTLSGDDVVIDLATGLMWAAKGNKAGCYSLQQHNCSNVLVYAGNLDFAGFTDWRVPNINELVSIVSYVLSNPAISEPPFSNTVSSYYHSSTTLITITTQHWVLKFDIGKPSIGFKTGNYYLRCVRGGL